MTHRDRRIEVLAAFQHAEADHQQLAHGGNHDLLSCEAPLGLEPVDQSGDGWRLILGFGVLDLASGDQGADQRAEKSLASFARVMNELEEPEVDREFLLRNAAMRPQPGAKQ